MAVIAESREHPCTLFMRGDEGAEAYAFKWFRDTGIAMPRCISRGQEISCSCIQKLTTDELNNVVPYIAHFSELNKYEQKVATMELIRASKQEFPTSSSAPRQLKHLKFRLPIRNDESATASESTKPRLVCQNAIVVILGKPLSWWEACASYVNKGTDPPLHHGLKGKPSNNKKTDKNRNQSERSKASKQKRQRNGQLGSLQGLVFDHCDGSNPTCASAPGSLKKRQDCTMWLQKARLKLEQEKHARNAELYSGGKDTTLQRHIYTNTQFCIKGELPQECMAIKVLGDGVFGKDLNKCHDFDDFVDEGDRFLRITAEAGRDLIEEKPEFLGAGIRDIPDKQLEKQWQQVAYSLETVMKPSELVQENGDLQDPRSLFFRAATLHDQIEGDQDYITIYNSHKDKVGNIVMFLPLSGESFNFIAMQSMRKNTTQLKGKKEAAKLETTGAGYRKYQHYKASLSEIDRQKVNKFESDFLQTAVAQKPSLPRVRVYKLSPSDKLCFAAKDYLHSTIIPMQKDRRALLVFHDLVPYSTSATTRHSLG